MTARARSVLITGGTRGLGHEVAAAFAGQGDRITILGRSDAGVRAAVAALGAKQTQHHGAVEGLVCDLGDERSVRAAIDTARGAPFDVLVNNAAVQGPIGPLHTVDWSAWHATVAVDLLAPALLMRLCLPPMIDRGWGRVINLSGGGATGPRPDFSAYAASKAALVRLTETVAHELAGSGVTVNAIAPGPMNTAMLDEVIAAGAGGATREYDDAVRRGREGGTPPAQAAALVLWLASEAGAAVTGRLISAVWDPWETLGDRRADLDASDIYTLRRIVPKDRGKTWGDR